MNEPFGKLIVLPKGQMKPFNLAVKLPIIYLMKCLGSEMFSVDLSEELHL